MSVSKSTQNVKALEDYILEVKGAWTISEIFQRFGLTANGTSAKGSETRVLGHGGLDINTSKGVWYTFAGEAGGKEVDAWYYCKYQSKMSKGEFMATIYEMGDAAGIDRPEFSEEQKARYEERRTLEEIFRFTADFYHAQLPAEQREWLHTRYGLTDATIDSLLIGFAPTGDQSLYKHLINDCHVATEDVEKSGLFRLNERGASDVFQGRIVFPYWNRNNVVYFIGRETDQTPQWEKEKRMKYAKLLVHGDKHPYVSEQVSNSYFYGEDDIRGAEDVFITEGVTDCIIANQAGLATVSPVTVSFRDSDHPKLIALLKNARNIYIINDNEANGSGRKGALSTATALWEVGKVVRFVELPRPEGVDKVDLNDFLREHSADDLRALLPTGKTLLDISLEAADKAEPGAPKADAQREVFRLLAHISDDYLLAQWRNELPKRMKMSKADYDKFLELAKQAVESVRAAQLTEKITAAKAQIAESESEEDRYMVIGGCICERRTHIDELTGGIEVSYPPLCNFDARIVANAHRDDGSKETELHLAIAGTLNNGQPLPKILVKTSEYERMGWVTEKWGARPAIEPGRSTRDKLRHAIQYLSEKDGIGEERIYTHTGWRVVDGKRIFLHAGGAVGMEGVTVELADGLGLYEFPTDNEVDTRTAMIESLRTLDIAPPHVGYPIWAMMYTAPLSEINEPAFLGWVQGQSSALKTSHTALFMTHYGKRFDDRHVPIDWISTENSIEKCAYLAKDVPLLVDDFRPPNASKEADALRTKAGRIATISGNRSGRTRMGSDTEIRKTYTPRGLVLATAEKELDGYSINGRMLTVNVEKGDVDKEKLGAAQAQPHVYGYAMRGYIEMLARDWDTLAKTLPTRQIEYRNKFSNDGHLRIPDAVATLYVGFELAMNYAVSIGAQTEAEAQDRCQTFYNVLVGMAEEQSANTAAQSPALRYMQTMITMVHAQKLYIKGEGYHADMGGGDKIGWHDGHDVYLTPAAYNSVFLYLQREGSLMPVSERGIRSEMVKLGWITKTTKGSNTFVTRNPLLDNKNDRVIVVSLDTFNEIAREMGITPSQLLVTVKPIAAPPAPVVPAEAVEHHSNGYHANDKVEANPAPFETGFSPAEEYEAIERVKRQRASYSNGASRSNRAAPLTPPDWPEYIPTEPAHYNGNGAVEPEVVTWTL